MKKFTLVSLVAAAAFATTAAFSASNVFAADETTGTKGTIDLTTATGEDGKTPLGITLDSAPAFNFGSQQITTAGKTYTIKGVDGASIDKPLSVTNNGVDATWTVSVGGTQFTTQDGTILKGAQLLLPKGAVTTGTDGNQSTPATSAESVTLDLSKGAASQPDVFKADKGQGVGNWLDTFDDASLVVPAGNVAGTYTSDLTWTLQNTPTTTTPANGASASNQG